MTLDHVTVRTTDLAASRHFFEMLFDLEERPRPAAIRHIPGCWLFSEGEPVVHLIAVRAPARSDAPRAIPSDAIDHVGMRIDDYDDFRARVEASGLPYHPMELPEIGERRLFLHAPGGPLIEAVYRYPLEHGARPAAERERAA